MKTRKKFIANVRAFYAQHEDAIQIAGVVILLIVLFIAGYLVSWNFLMKPYFGNGRAIYLSILMGLLFIFVSIVLLLIGDKIYKKIKKR